MSNPDTQIVQGNQFKTFPQITSAEAKNSKTQAQEAAGALEWCTANACEAGNETFQSHRASKSILVLDVVAKMATRFISICVASSLCSLKSNEAHVTVKFVETCKCFSENHFSVGKLQFPVGDDICLNLQVFAVFILR